LLDGKECTPRPDIKTESEEESEVGDIDSELEDSPDPADNIKPGSKKHPRAVEAIDLVSDEEGADSGTNQTENNVGPSKKHPRAVDIIDLVSDEEGASAAKRTRLYPRKCNFILTALMIWTHCLSAPGKKFTASGGIRLGSSIPRNPSSGHTIIDLRSEKEKAKGKGKSRDD
jgi:hypothetical protein